MFGKVLNMFSGPPAKKISKTQSKKTDEVLNQTIEIFGKKFWYKNGKLHRDDGPAIDGENEKIWYRDGSLHRDNGPAIERSGEKHWYKNGKKHRLDGPAIENFEYKCWYVNDKLHREDGPAIEYYNGTKCWFLDGINCSEEEFNLKMKIKIEANKNIKALKKRKFTDRIEYYYNGRLHRANGPAIEYKNGDKIWYRNGKIHRDKGPAKEFADGKKEWWINNFRVWSRN